MGLTHTVHKTFLTFSTNNLIIKFLCLTIRLLRKKAGTSLPIYPTCTHAIIFCRAHWRTAFTLTNPLDKLEKDTCQACVPVSSDTLQSVNDNFILRLRHVCCVKDAHFEWILMWYNQLLVMTHAAPSIGVICT